MTNITERQNEIKLDIMESLARSQKALVAIIESVAGISVVNEHTAKLIQENITAIAQYQGVLAARLAGFRFAAKKTGIPVSPWLNPDLTVSSCYSTGDSTGDTPDIANHIATDA